MRPLPSDRPDLDQRERVRDVKRRLAALLRLPLWRVEELIRDVAAKPITGEQLRAAMLDPRNRETVSAALFDLVQADVIETVEIFTKKGRTT